MDGTVTNKEIYDFIRPFGRRLLWHRFLWAHFVPPSLSFSYWKAMHGKLATELDVASRCFSMVSMCRLCCCSIETSSHLFLECSFVKTV